MFDELMHKYVPWQHAISMSVDNYLTVHPREQKKEGDR
jgi:hypothetical protein